MNKYSRTTQISVSNHKTPKKEVLGNSLLLHFSNENDEKHEGYHVSHDTCGAFTRSHGSNNTSNRLTTPITTNNYTPVRDGYLGGIIKEMSAFIRTWWLLNRLAKICIKGNVVGRGLVRVRATYDPPEAQNVKDPEKLFNALEIFLGARAEKYWFGFGCKTKKRKDYRVERDRYLLEECENHSPKLVETILGKDYFLSASEKKFEKFIRITGKGYEFSRPTNGLVEFAYKYKVIWFIILGFIGYAPLWRNWLVKITSPFSPFW